MPPAGSMKILVLSPYLPHPRSGHGGGEYVYGLVKYLSRSHAVTLLTFANEEEQKLAADLSMLPITVRLVSRWKGKQKNLFATLILGILRLTQLLRSILLWQPYYVSKFYHPQMARLVEEETTKTPFDIVQVEFAQMGQYARFVRHGKTVLRAHDVVFRPAYRNYKFAASLPRKMVSFIEWCRWARYEPKAARHFDHVLTFTDQDCRLLKRLAQIRHVTFNARGIEPPDVFVPIENHNPQVVLFVGAFDHTPNVDAAIWLCSEIFPLVLQKCPRAELRLVGRSAPRQLRIAAETHPAIRLTGFVENLEDEYNKAGVFVAPIRSGGGIKTKVIHAQSYCLPVVTTPKGAEGIEGENNSTIVVGRVATELADGIVKLIMDRKAAAEMARRGRNAVLRHYAWEAVIREQEEIYRSLLN